MTSTYSSSFSLAPEAAAAISREERRIARALSLTHGASFPLERVLGRPAWQQAVRGDAPAAAAATTAPAGATEHPTAPLAASAPPAAARLSQLLAGEPRRGIASAMTREFFAAGSSGARSAQSDFLAATFWQQVKGASGSGMVGTRPSRLSATGARLVK